VSTANNPAINDLGRDVLFELISQESGERMTRQFDENALPRLDKAIEQIRATMATANGSERIVFEDLLDRARTLRCWLITQRNTCAWVAGVHGYLETEDPKERDRWTTHLQEMIDLDLQNTRDLLALWEESRNELFLVSDTGETSFVFGDNMSELFRRKIELTEQYRFMAPRIDRDIMWRLP
jgi:hypothetical protein